MQAAVLSIKFPYLESWHTARRRNAELYTTLFCEVGLSQESGLTIFDEYNKVLLPGIPNKSEDVHNHHIFNQFVIRVQYRNALRAFLQEHGIGTEIYYPIPFHKQPCFVHLPSSSNNFPVSDCASTDVLALPIFPELQENQIQHVVNIIVEFYQTKVFALEKECKDCNCGCL